MTTAEMLKTANAERVYARSLTVDERDRALKGMAEALNANADNILAENEKDVLAARGRISDVMFDRLRLTRKRISDMADGILDVSALPDPVGRVLKRVERQNGLLIEKTSVPLGVVAIIFESRPNVASDAAALCVKSGNICVLRGGSDAFNSVSAIVFALREGLKNAGVHENMINQVGDASRAGATELMTARGQVDLLIPRGGAGLIRACVEQAKVPCIETGTGICHVYVDKDVDFDMSLDIIDNAKTSRPSVCNAMEALLVHKDIANAFLPLVKKRLTENRRDGHDVELRLCERAARIIEGRKASDGDFDTEFLDYVLAVKVVDSLADAIEHISRHSTNHSDAIISNDSAACAAFAGAVDSAAVYINASTRFTDGGVFGLGCEMGISTQKLHARGPMGLEELTTYKYIVRGNGQIRV